MPESTFRSTLSALAFDGDPGSRNPLRRPIQQGLDVGSLRVKNARTEPLEVAGLSTLQVFDTSVALTADASTNYSVAAPAGAPPLRYRLTWGGAGAAPGFRTRRAVALAGRTATLTLNADLTVVVTLDSTTPFGAVQVGDAAYIRGVSTFDAAGPLDPLNEGSWTVLAVSSASVTLVRDPGTVFSGLSQSAVLVSNDDLKFFSAAGVRVGDVVDVSAGFAAPMLHAYTVTAVTDDHVEFDSPFALAAATAVPGTSGLLAYRNPRAYTLIVSDQEVALRVNGDTADHLILRPVAPGDPDRPGRFELFGPVFSLSIRNRSTSTAGITVASWQ